MAHHALRLFDYHVWANQRVLTHLKELPGNVYEQPITSVFPSIAATVAHMYVVDHVWLHAMSGDSPEAIMGTINQIREQVQGRSVEEVEPLFTELYGRYSSFFNEHPDLGAVSTYTHPRLGTLNAPYAEIVQHIVNHGTYHRGNITAMLRQQGYPGVPTDYAIYLYDVYRQ